MPQPPPSSLRILCFGASITAGFHSFGLAPPHPYAHRLQQLLTAALPASTTITVSIDAVPGDRIINGNYTSRLRKHFPLPPYSSSSSSSSPSSYPSTSLAAAAAEKQQQQDDKKAKVPSSSSSSSYDWIILQAGGNDLASSSSSSTHSSSSSSPAAIFAALQQLWRICTADGATQVLALTVTETSSSSAQESTVMRDRYAALNAMIRDAAAAAAEGREKENGVWVADVEREVPYWGMEAGERRRVWDDGLHLTPRGYDLLGEKVGARLLEILKGQGGREERRERL